MNAKFGMLLGANLAVASIFMQGCKATKPHGGDQPPPPPHSSVDRPLPPPRTALENDIETTTLPPPPPPASATKVKPLPPPPPDAVPPPKAAPEPAIYIVQKGDTLSQICEKRGVRMSETLKLNPALAANPNRILVGAKIKLPAPGAALVPPPEAAAPGAKAQKLPPPPPAGAKKADDKKADVKPAPKGAAANVKAPAAKKAAYKPYTGPTKEYVVKSGDQLGKIAYSFGITVRALKELNGLAANDLKVGQKLKVPAEKVKPEEAKQDAPAAADKKDVGADAAAKKDDKAAAEPANKAAEPEKKANDAAPAASDAAPADLGAKADAPALSQSYETYVVKEGDDLVSIAINFGVSPSALMDLNDLKTGDSVKPGQTLKIPAGAKAP